MALVADNVRVAITGGIYFDPTGAVAPPTDAGSAIPAGFDDLGYLSEDGFTLNVENDTEDINAWQNGDLVRTVSTSHSLTAEMSFLETNDKSLAVFWGNFTAGAGGAGSVEVRAEQGVRGSWIFDVEDGPKDIRYVIPDGQVTERGEVSHVNGEAMTYPVTITAYADDTGVKAYIYTAEDAPPAAMDAA